MEGSNRSSIFHPPSFIFALCPLLFASLRLLDAHKATHYTFRQLVIDWFDYDKRQR